MEANPIKFNAREIPGVTPQGRLGLFELFSQRDLELIDKANYRWNEEQQALFIDSLINNVPTAPILLLDMILLPAEGHRYSIIDGSERIWSMRRFVKNELRLPADFCSYRNGHSIDTQLCYDALLQEQPVLRARFDGYKLPVYVIEANDRAGVTNILRRRLHPAPDQNPPN